MVHISDEILHKIAKKLKINTYVLDLNKLRNGLIVELEHGKRYKKFGLNITNDDLVMTAKIALSHIIEYPDYYTRLKILENEAKNYWKNKEKPYIFIPNK